MDTNTIQAIAPDISAQANEAIRPLRVLVTGYRSHPHVGGQGVYIRELTRSLRKLGHTVSVASGPPYPDLDDDIELIKLPALDLFTEDNALLALRAKHLSSWADMSEWLSHNTGAFGELYAFGRRLNRYLSVHADKYDVIHDNQTLATPFLDIQKRLPVITTLHHPIAIDLDYAVAAADKWWKRSLTKRWYRFVNMQAQTAREIPNLFAVSQAACDSHVEHYGIDPQNVKVAFNGIDHEIFYPDASVKREKGLIVTTASADAPIKGLDVLISALAEIADTHPFARLHIIGNLREGPAKKALTAHGLSDRVTTSSNLTREAIADLYRRAHIVACPARFEGFGFPAAEAMACGAAVAASDGGALPEVIGDAGMVSPVGDIKAMASNFAFLLDNPVDAQALGVKAAKRAKAEFNWSNHAQAASKMYTAALAKREERV